MSNDIALLEPDATPLTVLLKRMEGKKSIAINPSFKWLEQELRPRQDQVNFGTGYTAGATSIVVDNGAYFNVGDVAMDIATQEHLLVTAVSTNTLTVTRGWGTTVAGTITDNDYLMIIGSAIAEGADSPAIKTVAEATKTNYTQIFRTSFGVTGTGDASELYGGSDMNFQRKLKGIEHMKSMELAFLFGQPKEDTSGSQPIRQTGGLNYWISTNRTDAGGTLTEAEFETFLRSVFRYGKQEKLLVASPIVVSAINAWASGKIQMVPKDKTYGISVMKYLSGQGEINIAIDRALADFNTYNGYAFAVDTEFLKYRHLKDRDTKLRTNIQAARADAQEDEYLTEAGLEARLEKAHGVLYNVTSYA